MALTTPGFGKNLEVWENMPAELRDAMTMDDRDELDRLRDALRFTMSDTQRLLRQSDVEGICPHGDMCFEYGDRVRCGPCAIKQAEKHGVESDLTLPHSPEVYRLRRSLRAAETEVDLLNNTLKAVIDAYRDSDDQPERLRGTVAEVVGRYGVMVGEEFDPSLIAITEQGRLAYAGVELDFSAKAPEAVTLVRRVEEWAMDNLTYLPGDRWCVRFSWRR